MDEDIKLQFEGHSLGVRKPYTPEDKRERREIYAKVYTLLDVTEEGAVDQKFHSLEEELITLHKQNDSLKSHYETIKDEVVTRLEANMKSRMARLDSLELEPDSESWAALKAVADKTQMKPDEVFAWLMARVLHDDYPKK